MIEKSKVFTTIIITALILICTFASLITNANAAEPTVQQKGLTILNNVVDVDSSKYNVATKYYPPNPQATYLGVVPQESIIYNLTSDENKLSFSCTFANGNLQMMQTLEDNRAPSSIQMGPNADIHAAKTFLGNYQAYTSNELFGDLKATLNNVKANKSLTMTSGNLQLEVKPGKDGSTAFKWYYTANGAIAPYSKFISLSFKNGGLTSFVNNWQFYNVGSTKVNISKKEATAIAIDATKSCAHNMGLAAFGFRDVNVNESSVQWSSLLFDNSLTADKARSTDSLELFPVWRVGIQLDKWYGEMYGVEVDIWADTGQIRSIQEAYSDMPPPENAPTANMNSALSISSETSPSLSVLTLTSTIVISTIGAAIIWMAQKKKLHHHGPLIQFSKKTGGMLCILLSSLMLLAFIVPASAITSRRCSLGF